MPRPRPGLRMLCLALAAVLPAAQERASPPASAAAAAIPAAPLELVALRTFDVEVPMPFLVHGKERSVRKGYVLVLKVERALLEPHDAPDHVLFAGGCIAQRVNCGYEDGHLIALVPEMDLTQELLFFGEREVCARVTPEDVRRQQQDAQDAGIRPLAPERLAALQARAAPPLHARDKNELWYETKPLILRYAPSERAMAESLSRD